MATSWPEYEFPRGFRARFIWSWLTLRPRSYARDALWLLSGSRPELEVLGAEHIPPDGPCLVLSNHYIRPGFRTWWFAFAISAAVAARRAPGADLEIHWIIARQWTYPRVAWRDRAWRALTRFAFARMIRFYGFIGMPPMPPRPCETEERARAVLHAVRLARQGAVRGIMIGTAPEGRDSLPGVSGLTEPPPGMGSFVALLVQAGLPVLPVAVYEFGGRLRVSVGTPFVPEIPADHASRDACVSHQVMAAIAEQLTKQD